MWTLDFPLKSLFPSFSLSQIFSTKIYSRIQYLKGPTNRPPKRHHIIITYLVFILFSFSLLWNFPGKFVKKAPRNRAGRGKGMSSTENPNWVFDYGLLDDISVPGGDLPSLEPPGAFWSSNNLSSADASLSMEFDDTLGISDSLKEPSSRKRMRSGSCAASGSKACREKLRRDKLNDRFLELGSVLDPGKPCKIDKSAVLADAIRMVTQLRDEAQKLKDSNHSLREKISELKGEKNELRDEKQRLKTEKESLERKMNAFSTPQQGFLPHPSTIQQTQFSSAGGHVIGSTKLVPFVGYPGVSMWQFLPPAAVDTSQDHILRPPVA